MNLNEPKFRPFSLKAIAPLGWLEQQLCIQASGLSGHLDEFWPDVKDSAWIGGEAEGWERMPYWLDGAIPLAWLLNEEALKQRISEYLDYIIEHQHPDGWLGPRVKEKKEAADVWSQALAMKMLVVYHDATGDERVPLTIEKALRMLDRQIDARPLSTWGLFRWFEFLISIWWLYERKPEVWLLELAVKIQAQGFHWQSFFKYWPLDKATEKGRWNLAGHTVNNAMALKESALWWRFTGVEQDKNAVYEMTGKLDDAHGMVTGVFTGDECLAGKNPSQGTEMCAVIEHMYSLECLVGLLGDPSFADRLEKITFNALPATFSPDMWSHQYDQQVNQVECSVLENRLWNTNNADANIFGLEPHFGCCTANLSQGWPKFAAHLWMQASDDGIAAIAYAPSRLNTTIHGTKVCIELETGYPFRELLKFTVVAEQPVTFSLFLRIPDWAEEATLDVGDGPGKILMSGDFHEIRQEWRGTSQILLNLPMHVRTEARPGNTISVQRGPLIYAAKIDEEWQQINEDKPYRELPHGDWEVHPTSAWNYGLKVAGESPLDGALVSEHLIGDCPFSPEGAPVSLTVKAQRVPEWLAQNGSAAIPPSSIADAELAEEELLLIPYGCTNLRIAEFPKVT